MSYKINHLGVMIDMSRNSVMNVESLKKYREFLKKAEDEGQVVPCDDLPKTFLLTAEYGLSKVYLTALSASTLEKRLK